MESTKHIKCFNSLLKSLNLTYLTNMTAYFLFHLYTIYIKSLTPRHPSEKRQEAQTAYKVLNKCN